MNGLGMMCTPMMTSAARIAVELGMYFQQPILLVQVHRYVYMVITISTIMHEILHKDASDRSTEIIMAIRKRNLILFLMVIPPITILGKSNFCRECHIYDTMFRSAFSFSFG